MKFVFLALVLVLGLAASVALVRHKKESITHKKESAVMRFEVRDFPEHGVSLIVPSNPAFGQLLAKRTEYKSDPYSILLKNTGTRAVVGYSLKWECFDDRGETSDRNLANDRNLTDCVSWIFLHGEESDRKEALNRSQDVVKPHSIWLISSEGAIGSLEWNRDAVAFSTTQLDESSEVKIIPGCASMRVTVDGIFFDDGTFIGPDGNGLFTNLKSEMAARREILRGIQNDLKVGKKADEIFKELEKVRDGEAIRLGAFPTADEYRAFFRNLFAKDVLGKKEYLGVDKTIEDIQRQLSKPWVTLRKL